MQIEPAVTVDALLEQLRLVCRAADLCDEVIADALEAVYEEYEEAVLTGLPLPDDVGQAGDGGRGDD